MNHLNCKLCGKFKGVERAHLISRSMAKIIAERQGFKTKELIDLAIMKLHPRKGHLWLCDKCHEISDNEQKRILEKLKESD